MTITILTIPHSEQRYPTCGDWIWEGDDLTIKVSDTGNPDHAILLGIHEMIEAYLCRKNGIEEVTVTAFDMAFEASRPSDDDSEPGDDFEAPYHHQHIMASDIERYAGAILNVDWDEYTQKVNAL